MSSPSDPNLINELNVAVAFWTKLVRQKLASQELAAKFESAFSIVLFNDKLKNHWYPDSPRKGQAHRSVSLDRLARPDPVLIKACNVVGLHNIFDLLPSAIESLFMWVDPGEVMVKISRPNLRPVDEVLYKQEVRPPSPIHGMPLNSHAHPRLMTRSVSPTHSNAIANQSVSSSSHNNNNKAFPLRPRSASPPSHHTEQFWQRLCRSPSPPTILQPQAQQVQQQPQILQPQAQLQRPYSLSPPPSSQMYYYNLASSSSQTSSPAHVYADRYASSHQQASWRGSHLNHPGVSNSGENWEYRETVIQA